MLKSIKHIYSSILLAITLCIFTSGCMSFSPLGKFKRGEEKREENNKDIENKRAALDEKSTEYVYAADFALSLDPTPNVYSSTAKSMTGRSLLITGNPKVKSSLDIQDIVKKLTSTNLLQQAEGAKKLTVKDAQAALSQGKLQQSLDKKDEIDEKNRKLAEENAGWAQKWYNLWKWIKIIFFTCVIATLVSFALKFYSMVNPAVAVGLNTAKVPFRIMKEGFSNLISAGESFKNSIKKEIDDPELRDRVLELFRVSHQIEQSKETQNKIRDLTKKTF